ncbi:MAG: hypothetical protein WC840_03155 [Candidatus Peribacteraceae bacterium]
MSTEVSEGISDASLLAICEYTLVPDAVRALSIAYKSLDVLGLPKKGLDVAGIMARLELHTPKGLQLVREKADEILRSLAIADISGDVRERLAKTLAAKNPLIEPIRRLFADLGGILFSEVELKPAETPAKTSRLGNFFQGLLRRFGAGNNG